MKDSYDFSKGKRGAVVKMPETKERITIRLDRDIVNWFRDKVDSAGGGNYQTLMNEALRAHIQPATRNLEEALRRSADKNNSGAKTA